MPDLHGVLGQRTARPLPEGQVDLLADERGERPVVADRQEPGTFAPSRRASRRRPAPWRASGPGCSPGRSSCRCRRPHGPASARPTSPGPTTSAAPPRASCRLPPPRRTSRPGWPPGPAGPPAPRGRGTGPTSRRTPSRRRRTGRRASGRAPGSPVAAGRPPGACRRAGAGRRRRGGPGGAWASSPQRPVHSDRLIDGRTTQHWKGKVRSPSKERAVSSRTSNMALRAWETGFLLLVPRRSGS